MFVKHLSSVEHRTQGTLNKNREFALETEPKTIIALTQTYFLLKYECIYAGE